MPDPVFVIHVGQNSTDCRVVCNAKDITGSIQKIEFSIEAGSLPVLKLTTAYAAAVADIRAAIENVSVDVPAADVASEKGRPIVVDLRVGGLPEVLWELRHRLAEMLRNAASDAPPEVAERLKSVAAQFETGQQDE